MDEATFAMYLEKAKLARSVSELRSLQAQVRELFPHDAQAERLSDICFLRATELISRARPKAVSGETRRRVFGYEP